MLPPLSYGFYNVINHGIKPGLQSADDGMLKSKMCISLDNDREFAEAQDGIASHESIFYVLRMKYISFMLRLELFTNICAWIYIKYFNFNILLISFKNVVFRYFPTAPW